MCGGAQARVRMDALWRKTERGVTSRVSDVRLPVVSSEGTEDISEEEEDDDEELLELVVVLSVLVLLLEASLCSAGLSAVAMGQSHTQTIPSSEPLASRASFSDQLRHVTDVAWCRNTAIISGQPTWKRRMGPREVATKKL